MAWYNSLAWTLILIFLSAFFVIIEFSMLSARRHRLEEEAETSGTARAGLRSLNELTVMLAGAQLGITSVTFALGAITKPWVHSMIEPLLTATGLPHGTSYAVSFLLSLFIVTFIHLVIGEMAPKSWAIAHPEAALSLVAIPARWFVAVFRPLLLWINHTANRLVERAGAQPVDRAAAKGYTTDMLHHLIQHSVESGALDQESAQDIEGVINIESATAGEAIHIYGSTTGRQLPADATVADVHRSAREHGFLRIFLTDPDSPIPNVVYIRETTLADPAEPAANYAHAPQRVDKDTAIATVLDLMRDTQEQIVVVLDGDEMAGIITWDDIMNQLWPEIEHHIDQVKGAGAR